jgi:hypothetical protein
MTHEEYTDEIKRLEDKIDRLDKRMAEAAESPRYAERVRKLRAFRGIDYLTALSLVEETETGRDKENGERAFAEAAH